jgi:putative ABC transport system permease protein
VVGSTGDVALYQTASSIYTTQTSGRNFTGPVYVATPQLLKAFDIAPSSINPGTEILSMRPGLASQPHLEIAYNNPNSSARPIVNPSIQEVSQLPSGTSAPNTVITEYTVNKLGLTKQMGLNGWLLTTAKPLTTVQVTNARSLAATQGMSVESQNSLPTSAEVLNLATLAGVILALSILAMSIGLIRSEGQRDLRTLSATGASSWTRRSITAWTALSLAFVGALLGTFGAYVASYAFSENDQNASSAWQAVSHVPLSNLLLILVAMPVAAFVGGWLFAGREPRMMAQQPME